MALFRRARRDGPVMMSGGRTSFAAQRINLSAPGRPPGLGQGDPRQAEAWNAYTEIGEIGQVVDLFASALGRITLFPAIETADGRIPADEGEPDERLPASLVEQARVELDRIKGVYGGRAGVLDSMAVHYKVPGEGWLVGFLDAEGREVWGVFSRDSIAKRGNRWLLAIDGDTPKYEIDPATSIIGRFWRPNPRFPGRPFSEMSRLLGHAEGLQLIAKSLRNAHASRAAGAGVLLFDTAAQIGSGGSRDPGATGGSIKDGDFMDDMMDYLAAPIIEPGSVASFSPLVADIPVPEGKTVRDMFEWITFDRDITEIELRREEALIKRIGYGLDAPPELVTGVADLNHWNAWVVRDDTWQTYFEPLAWRVGDAIATIVVKPALLAAGFALADVDRLVIGADASNLLSRPDPAKDAFEAHDRIVISDAALRRILKISETDAPSDDEKLQRMALKRGITTADLTRELLRGYAGADDLTPPFMVLADGTIVTREQVAAGEIEAPAVETESSIDEGTSGGETIDPPAAEPRVESGAPELAAVVASTRRPLGDTLAAIDLSLRDRLQAASDAAVRRGLERAHGKLRNRARRSGFAAQVDATPPEQLASLTDAMAALALTSEDLITDTDIGLLEQQWDEWEGSAWEAGLAALLAAGFMIVDGPATEPWEISAESWAQAETEHIETSAAGRALLVAAVLAIARNVIDVAPDETPTVGEAVSGLVPPGPVREALAVAGGAQGGHILPGGGMTLDADQVPAGGVASGEFTTRLVREGQGELEGWRWQVGSPRVPFPPHQDLDGVEFSTLQSPDLVNLDVGWLGTFFAPGDHPGCQCSLTQRWELPG